MYWKNNYKCKYKKYSSLRNWNKTFLINLATSNLKNKKKISTLIISPKDKKNIWRISASTNTFKTKIYEILLHNIREHNMNIWILLTRTNTFFFHLLHILVLELLVRIGWLEWENKKVMAFWISKKELILIFLFKKNWKNMNERTKEKKKKKVLLWIMIYFYFQLSLSTVTERPFLLFVEEWKFMLEE